VKLEITDFFDDTVLFLKMPLCHFADAAVRLKTAKKYIRCRNDKAKKSFKEKQLSQVDTFLRNKSYSE